MSEALLGNPETTLSEDGVRLKAKLMDIYVSETLIEQRQREKTLRAQQIINPKNNGCQKKIYLLGDWLKKYYDKLVGAENDFDLVTALGDILLQTKFSLDDRENILRDVLIPYIPYFLSIDVKATENNGWSSNSPIVSMIGYKILMRDNRDIFLPLLPHFSKTDGGCKAICGMVEGCFILGPEDREQLRGLLVDLSKNTHGTHAIALMVSEGFFGPQDKDMLWGLIQDILNNPSGAHDIASMISEGVFTLTEIRNAFELDESQLQIITETLREDGKLK